MTDNRITKQQRQVFKRDERRQRDALRRECRQRGLPSDELERLFAATATARLEEIVAMSDGEIPERVFREHVSYALRDAKKAALATLHPDESLPYAPPGRDAAMLEDVLLAVDSLVVLLERHAFKRLFAPILGRCSSDENAPVHRWKGADVRIVESPWPGYSGSSTVVVTEHASQLGGLFEQLWRLAEPAIDFRSKYEFYGRIAEAANAWLGQHPETDRHDLILTAAYEARAVLEDWQARAAEVHRNRRD